MSFFKHAETIWGEVHQMPDLEHELFFDYLTISPSYQYAHEIRSKKNSIKEKDLRKTNFSKVLDTYEVMGCVFSLTFDEWWTKIGQFVFVDEGKFSKLNFTLNMLSDKSVLMNQIESAIDRYKEILANNNKKIQVQNNKINIDNLNFLKHLVVIKGAQEFHEKKSLPDWMVGVYAADYRPNSKYAESFINRYPDLFTSTISLDKNKNNERDRMLLGQLVSRQLKESIVISENAAYGIFPSKKKNARIEYKKFDFDKCREFFWSRKIIINGQDVTYEQSPFDKLNYYKWKKFERKYGEDALPHPMSEEERADFIRRINNEEIKIWDL
jgi:hypothetical protein